MSKIELREWTRRIIDTLIVEDYHIIHQVDKNTEATDRILKVLAKWGIEICSDHQDLSRGFMSGVVSRRECPKCWQTLTVEGEVNE